MEDIDQAEPGAIDQGTTERRATADYEQEPAIEPLVLNKNSFGTALGAAMLGFEQALRREPPAEILAAEHAPERGYSGDGSHFVIEFPEAVGSGSARKSDSDPGPDRD